MTTLPDARDATEPADAGPSRMLSHARNAEDVVLARAFADRAGGTWLDVAADPAADGVTRALAARGWRGADIVAGETPPRLDALLAAQPGAVDLLRVAVGGGGEAAILATADWQAARPVILLIEAVDAAGAPNHHGWHRRLVNANYRFALFDGISRFYVREEDGDALMPLLLAPANALDGWRRADDAARIAALEAAVANRPDADPALAAVAARVPTLEAELAGLRETARREAERAANALADVRALETALAQAHDAAQQANEIAAAEQARADELAAALATARSPPTKSGGPLSWLTGGGRGR